MRQLKLKKITGKIIVRTGLHIGAGNDKVEIGGMDNPVIRNPLTREPYIPGSSLKGKLRSLIEWKLGLVGKNGGNPCSCGKSDCPVCRVFGSANQAAGAGESESKSKSKGPTRIIMRDAVLAKEWKEMFLQGKPVIEEKNENRLNRITAEATPRPVERVVPGAEFDFELAYRVIDTDDGGATDETYFRDVVIEGLRMLESDYLGGGGTRGNGQIEFSGLKDENGKEIVL